MTEQLASLQSYHAAEWLLVAAAILILIDYFFPTDWPAHLGYVCVAASIFYFVWSTAPGSRWHLVPAFILSVAVWIGLAILHRLAFRHLLTNAPGADDAADIAVESAIEEQPNG